MGDRPKVKIYTTQTEIAADIAPTFIHGAVALTARTLRPSVTCLNPVRVP
jgi:hypothetical protein